MMNQISTSMSIDKDQYKQFQPQLKINQEGFKKQQSTRQKLSIVTGVNQKKSCRNKIDLELSRNLWEVKKQSCKQTACKSWYLIANPEFKPEINRKQLKLF